MTIKAFKTGNAGHICGSYHSVSVFTLSVKKEKLANKLAEYGTVCKLRARA